MKAFDQADQLAIVSNFNAVLEGFEEDRIGLWQPLDEGKGNAATIGKNQSLLRHLFDNNGLIQPLGVPEGNW